MTDQTQDPFAPFTPAQLVEYAMQIRAQRSDLKAEFDKTDKDLKAKLSLVEAALNRRMNADGIENLRTASGLAYVHRDKRFTCQDWEAAYNFMLKENRPDMLQRRLSKSVLDEYLDTTGQLPPGVTVETVRELRFRKS